MKIDSTPFPRKSLSQRQLLREDPQAGQLLERFQGTTVGEMQLYKQRRLDTERGGGHWHTGAAVATGAAGLALGALWTPWAGLGLGVISALFARQAVKSYAAANSHAADLKGLDGLAERTAKNLVQPQADGTVIDRRFLDQDCVHDAHEVSRDGKVLQRSVRLEMYDDEEVTAVADVPAGTVTLQGPLGKSTFPGILTLPTPDSDLTTVVRTDQEIHGYNRTEWRFDASDGTLDLDMRHGDSDWHIGNSVTFRGLKNGVIVGLDEAGHAIAMKSPVDSHHLWDSEDRNDEVAVPVSWEMLVHKRAQVPKLKPLEAYDLTDAPVVGGSFRPLGHPAMALKVTPGKVHFDSRAAGGWSVAGQLLDDGRIQMKQGKYQVYQTLTDESVRLTMEGGPAEITLRDDGNGAPEVECGGEKVAASHGPNGAYVVELASGPVKVKPAVTLKRLKARD